MFCSFLKDDYGVATTATRRRGGIFFCDYSDYQRDYSVKKYGWQWQGKPCSYFDSMTL